MSNTHWHLRVTIASSTKAEIQAMADKDRRSVSVFVAILLEKAAAQTGSAPVHDPR